MNKKTLLPTDFSDNSWNAIVYALKLYQAVPTTFYLLNANELYASTTINLTKRVANSMKERSIKNLKELRGQLEMAEVSPEFDFQILSSSKSLVPAIESTVIENGIDLVVMGTKGANGAKGLFMGSNTVRTIKSMNLCPVFIIPEGFDFSEPTEIAFPTDFNRFYSRRALKSLKELAKLYNSKIRIVHINVEEKLDSIQEYNVAMLKDYLEDFEHSFHWMPDFTKKSKAINIFIEDMEVDILVMFNYHHTLLENMTKEPVIKKIGFHPKVPSLIIPHIS